MSKQDKIVIVAAARTPIGAFQGQFKDKSAVELGSVAIRGSINRAGIDPESIDEVVFGCVLSAGLGQAPARQAALGAGLSLSAGATTINKMCGSGMKAVMLANDLLKAGSANIVVAGGMESMTNAPYLLDRARSGYRLGHNKLIDHMFLDGLEDAYDKGRLMGSFAEDCAEEFKFSREEQDDYAIRSLKNTQKAIENNSFTSEIEPVRVTIGKSEESFSIDEQPSKVKIDKIPTLKSVFRKNGTVTAANSSSISDGAAALILMRDSDAEKQRLSPLATICGHTTFAQAPNLFTTAPVGAIKKLCENLAWDIDSVDLFEINEAFAVVPMVAIRQLGLPPEKVNVHGGACALGHPIGASGARVLVTLIYALQKYGLKRGIAAVCIGGGEATAVAIEIET